MSTFAKGYQDKNSSKRYRTLKLAIFEEKKRILNIVLRYLNSK